MENQRQFYVRLGELLGSFKQLNPALNYLRGKVDSLVQEVASITQSVRIHQETVNRDLERLRDDMKVFKEEVRGRLSSGTNDFHGIDRKLDDFERRIKILEERKASGGAKRWQIVVAVISAALSMLSALAVALILYYVKKP